MTRPRPATHRMAHRAARAPTALLALALLGACAPHAAPPAAPAEAPAPPHTRAVTPTEAAALGSLPAGLGLAPGTPAPDAALEDTSGAAVHLGDWIGEGWVLVVFYRGGWCPYCNHQVHDLGLAAPEFAARGVTSLLVSVDRVEEAARTRASWTLPFPVLADPDLHAHEAFGVVHQADAAEVARLRGFGIDLEAASGRDHHRFAVPSQFLVDPDGVIRWAHADPDYKTRPSVEQVLAVIDAAQAGPR